MGVAKKFNKKKERQKYAKSKLGKDASKQEDV